VACPFGYRWSLSVPKEELDAAEMQKRWTRMLEGGKA
jgi:PhnB protein